MSESNPIDPGTRLASSLEFAPDGTAALAQAASLAGAVLPRSMVEDAPRSDVVDIHSDAFLHELMRRQLVLSVSCAGTFLVLLFGLPLANYLFPEIMATRVFGFTLTWLILGLGFFPVVWVISWVFIRRSQTLEAEEVRRAKAMTDQKHRTPAHTSNL